MIEVIAGTNRPGSNALKVARVLEGMYHQLGAEARVLSLGDLPPEIFDPSSYAKKPDSFRPFQDRVLEADGLHVVTPEYNGSFPGVLKYFVDMLKFPESFEHKPVAFTGESAGAWGALRSVEQLQLIFGYRNAYILPERVWMPKINDKLSEDGSRIVDDSSRERLEGQCGGFLSFIKNNSGKSASPLRKTQS